MKPGSAIGIDLGVRTLLTGADDTGQAYNINADAVAGALAPGFVREVLGTSTRDGMVAETAG